MNSITRHICDNLGNINIISKYINDTDLSNHLSNHSWDTILSGSMLFERYNFEKQDKYIALCEIKSQYDSCIKHTMIAVCEIVEFYISEYDSDNIEHNYLFNNKKKTLNLWLRLSKTNYNKLIGYLYQNYTLVDNTFK
jgi:hypothetical protein